MPRTTEEELDIVQITAEMVIKRLDKFKVVVSLGSLYIIFIRGKVSKKIEMRHYRMYQNCRGLSWVWRDFKGQGIN